MKSSRSIRASIGCALAWLLAAPMVAAAAELKAKHADWTSYHHQETEQRLCFVVSEPKDKQPKGAPRDPAFFYVSAWPKAGVRAEISIKLGYAVKKGSEATVTVDEQPFRLFAESDRAYVADPTLELKLIEAMRKGTRMTVQATSEKGTATTDSYSLAGVTQALQALTTGCQ